MNRARVASRRAAAIAALVGLFAVGGVPGCGARPEARGGEPELRRTVERLLAEMRAGEVEAAAAALVAIGPPALPALSEALAVPDADFRLAVIEVVGEIDTAQGVDLLLAALADASWEVRLEAVEALGELRERRAVEPLLALYRREGDRQVRYECLTSLGRIGDLAAADVLVAETSNADPNTRGWAIDALCQLPDDRAVERSLALLSDSNPFVRRQTLRSCKLLLDGDEARRTVVHMAIHDENFESSVWARRAFVERLGRASGTDPLREEARAAALAAVGDRAIGGTQRVQAALLLGDLGDDRAIVPLVEGLSAANSVVRQNVAHMLGQLPDARAVPALIRALDDPEDLIRATAADSLQQHASAGDPRASAALAAYTGPRFDRPLER